MRRDFWIIQVSVYSVIQEGNWSYSGFHVADLSVLYYPGTYHDEFYTLVF